MRLSIIIPVFNEGEKMRRALDMLNQQSVRPEIVVVDGGSTDGTLDIINEYHDINLVRETGLVKNPANARNQGLEAATGDIVFFADCDAIFEETFTEKIIMEFISSGADAVAFYVEPLKPEKFASRIQEAYYWRDASRWIASKNVKSYVLKKQFMPKQEIIGYGEDKIHGLAVMKAVNSLEKVRQSPVILGWFQLGPVCFKQVWKRHLWYGRSGLIYTRKRGDRAHLLKLSLCVAGVLFPPFLVFPAVRGIMFALPVAGRYPLGLVTIPFLEAVGAYVMGFGVLSGSSPKGPRG